METCSQSNNTSVNVLSNSQENPDELSRDELYHLIHELQVYQGDLEQQLTTSQSKLTRITEQFVKTTEELESVGTELRRYEQEFKAISDHSPDIIARFDRKLRHLYVNAAIEATTGIPAPTFIGKTHHELGLSGEIYTYWGKSCLGVFETGLEEMVEFDLPTPNGIHWYHARLVPEFGEDGYVETVLSIAHDITERKRAEEELRIYQKYLKNLAEQRTKQLAQRNKELQREIEERKRIEERLRFTEFSVERSSTATIWLEADGTIFRLNDATSQLLGYSNQELLSMHMYDFKLDLPEGGHQETWEDFWRQLIRRHHFDREFHYKRQNGELRVFEMSSNYFEYDARGYCLAFLRDITERKQAETELQQAKEAAEAANHAKSVFLANVSHEFRTPLNGILGYTQLLKRDRSLTTKLHEIIDTMHASGEHLLLIINDVLDLSKIEAQKIELEPKEFHLLTFLRNIVAICRIRAQQQKISFNYETSADLPESILGDEKCLRQVLLNLLGNAIKFTRKGGVTLRVSRRQKAESRRPKAEGRKQKAESVILNGVGGRQGERINEEPDTTKCLLPATYSSLPVAYLSFEVEDTGIGISAEQLEKIFLPFYQAQEKLAHSEGTGLGLAISQRLARIMKSELHVKSTMGQGSVFWFELDLPEISREHFQARLEGQKYVIGVKGLPPTVLIADDKQENRMLLKDILVSLGFEVFEASNGREALDRTLTHSPDIILMDLVMPVMDGLEAIKHIRQAADLEHLIVIAVSASVFAQTRQECIELGYDDFISKPVQLEELLKKLQTHLKLEWMYQNEEIFGELGKESEQAPLIPPPQEDLANLLNLAMMGDVMSIQDYAAAMKKREPALTPFSHKLEQFAKDFLVEEIQMLLQQYTGEES